MYRMVEHSFIVSPGYVAVHTRMSVHSTLIVSEQNMEMQLSYLMDMKVYLQNI